MKDTGSSVEETPIPGGVGKMTADLVIKKCTIQSKLLAWAVFSPAKMDRNLSVVNKLILLSPTFFHLNHVPVSQRSSVGLVAVWGW